jgi:hypothetical protein
MSGTPVPSSHQWLVGTWRDSSGGIIMRISADGHVQTTNSMAARNRTNQMLLVEYNEKNARGQVLCISANLELNSSAQTIKADGITLRKE